MKLRNLLGLMSLACAAWAQPLSFTLLPAGDSAPSPRADGAIAYDPATRHVYLFGGIDGSTRNDLWVYSAPARRWSELSPTGELPAPRFGHTLVFDSVRRRLILFGGQAGGFFSDVWAYEIETGAWRRLSANDTGPASRYGHGAIYDAGRDRLIVTHGFTTRGRFDDTWAFDLASNQWRDLSPANTRPLRRCLMHSAYDSEGDRMWIYGGCASPSGPCPLGDLWSFDLARGQWTEHTPTSGPAPREHYGMSFDMSRRRLLLFGGTGGGRLGDTWAFDPQRRAWERPAVEGALPAARSRHESAYGESRGVTFFFGGETDSGRSNELWMLGAGFAAEPPRIAAGGVLNAFSGQGGAVAPGEIVSIYGSGLGPLEGVAFGFDPITGMLPVSGPGVTVAFNGIAAPLYYASATQINAQVPIAVGGSTEARLIVTVNGSASEPVLLGVAVAAPGLFPRIWNQDGSVNSVSTPAARESIVVLYGTGTGGSTIALRVGGAEAELLYADAAPGAQGVVQVNARLPAGAGPGLAGVELRAGGAVSQPALAVAIE